MRISKPNDFPGSKCFVSHLLISTIYCQLYLPQLVFNFAATSWITSCKNSSSFYTLFYIQRGNLVTENNTMQMMFEVSRFFSWKAVAFFRLHRLAFSVSLLQVILLIQSKIKTSVSIICSNCNLPWRMDRFQFSTKLLDTTPPESPCRWPAMVLISYSFRNRKRFRSKNMWKFWLTRKRKCDRPHIFRDHISFLTFNRYQSLQFCIICFRWVHHFHIVLRLCIKLKEICIDVKCQ